MIAQANGTEEGKRRVELVLLPLHLSGGRRQGPPAPRGRAGAHPKPLSGSEMFWGFWSCNCNQGSIRAGFKAEDATGLMPVTPALVTIIRSHLCAHPHAPLTLRRAPSLSDNGYRECLANGSWAARVNYSQCQEILSEEVGSW